MDEVQNYSNCVIHHRRDPSDATHKYISYGAAVSGVALTGLSDYFN
jgi:hypothetical protein